MGVATTSLPKKDISGKPRSRRKRENVLQRIPCRPFGLLDVVVGLQAQPEPMRGVEGARPTLGDIGGNGLSPGASPVDAQRINKFLLEELPRVNVWQSFQFCPAVIVAKIQALQSPQVLTPVTCADNVQPKLV